MYYDKGYESVETQDIKTIEEAKNFLSGVSDALETILELNQTGESYKTFSIRFTVEERK